MSRKVSNPKKMGLSSGKNLRNSVPSINKIKRLDKSINLKDLPNDGGNGLDNYTLDVMILK